MSKLSMISMLAIASLAFSACSDGDAVDDDLTVDILNSAGAKIGTLEIEDEGDDGVEIEVSISGLQPGTHAMHIHETGLCQGPDYTSAGGHYNPTSVSHGKVADGPHAGDMMNIEIDDEGLGEFEIDNERVSLRGRDGLPALMDANGSALIIHAKADDYKSQPSGAAGARVACAVIPAAR